MVRQELEDFNFPISVSCKEPCHRGRRFLLGLSIVMHVSQVVAIIQQAAAH